MAHPTAFRHHGTIILNRADGSAVALTMEEAATVAALVSPSADARAAAENHLAAHRTLLGTGHGSVGASYPPRAE
jgi:hypothetical protein